MAVDPNAVCTEEACCICFESPIREPTRTKCNHWFCWYVAVAHQGVFDTLFDTRVVSSAISLFNSNALSSTAMVSALHCATAGNVDSAWDHVPCYLFMSLNRHRFAMSWS